MSQNLTQLTTSPSTNHNNPELRTVNGGQKHFCIIPRASTTNFFRIYQWDTKEAQNQTCQFWGVNGRTELCEIPSMQLFASFPHEWMHLVLENHGKGLLELWKGTYKDLDEGKQKYIINEAIWAQIGSETTLSLSTIPSSFVQHTPNIYTEQYLFTAEDYGHWFLYIAPFVLWN